MFLIAAVCALVFPSLLPFLHIHHNILTYTLTGGRTAWSTIANIGTAQYPAKFWYDGQYLAQAKEDSAEVALRYLTGTTGKNVDPPPASYYEHLQNQK